MLGCGSGGWGGRGRLALTDTLTPTYLHALARAHGHTDADGEKEEENKRLKEFREMLAGRPKHVKAAFKDLHARAVKECVRLRACVCLSVCM